MAKKVDYEMKSVNVPSWAMPISMINKFEILAENMGVSKSHLLQTIISDYFNQQPKEMFIYPEDAEFEKCMPKEGEDRYIPPLFI